MHRRAPLHKCRDVLAEGWTHFESVAGAAADEPHVVERGMSVDEVVAITRLLVLARARFHEGSVREPGESFAHDPSRVGQAGRRRRAVHGSGVYLLAQAVVGDFHSASLVAWDAVHDMVADVDPRW